jgi:hypothetical protein
MIMRVLLRIAQFTGLSHEARATVLTDVNHGVDARLRPT